MNRPIWMGLAAASIAVCAVAIGVNIGSAKDEANTTLSVLILVIAGLTLWSTVPRPARLVVDRLDEAELSDLIFFIYPKDPGALPTIPGDYLLQLHVAVSNLGGRKAVLSAIRIEGFRNAAGEVVHLPDAPEQVSGVRWTQRSGWIDGARRSENMNEPGPYVLEPDDVIVIRFRIRRGIDWSDRWNVEALAEFCGPLLTPITGAFGSAVWRRGGVSLATASRCRSPSSSNRNS